MGIALGIKVGEALVCCACSSSCGAGAAGKCTPPAAPRKRCALRCVHCHCRQGLLLQTRRQSGCIGRRVGVGSARGVSDRGSTQPSACLHPTVPLEPR